MKLHSKTFQKKFFFTLVCKTHLHFEYGTRMLMMNVNSLNTSNSSSSSYHQHANQCGNPNACKKKFRIWKINKTLQYLQIIDISLPLV